MSFKTRARDKSFKNKSLKQESKIRLELDLSSLSPDLDLDCQV